MKKILVVGHKGKMGSLIAKALENDYVVLGIDKGEKLKSDFGVDLVIDFASGSSSVKLAEFCLKHKIPLIIGSTGQTEAENKRIDKIAKQITIIKQANFSRGMEVLKSFIKTVLNFKPDSIELIEKHHVHKKDKPSGTALELASYIKELVGMDAKITSIREGEEMGEHRIIVKIGDETLEIKHNVYSRDAFVQGVIAQVKNLTK